MAFATNTALNHHQSVNETTNHSNTIFSDTSIAELIKKETDSDEFMDSLRTQQGRSTEWFHI